MSDSPYGPVQKGLVGNRASNDNRVVAFPSRQWREERLKIVNSTDPIDVATAFDAKGLHKEVDRRVDAKNANAASRSGVFHKAATMLGLTEDPDAQ